MNKINNKAQHTSVGDEINYFVNGVNKIGIVVKMSGSYITMFNNDKYDIVHIDETFFVKDIIEKNKSWNDMSMEERSNTLYDVKAYSPRFLDKTWEQLPLELREVILVKKSNIENGTYGSAAGSPNTGISTNINFDADKDYEGHSHDDKSVEFKLEDAKPSIKKDGIGNGMMSTNDSGSYEARYGKNNRVKDQEKDKEC